MGRLIDIDKARKEYSNLTDLTMSDTTLLLTLFGVLDNSPTVDAIPREQIAQLKRRLEKLPFYFGTSFRGETIKTVNVEEVLAMLNKLLGDEEQGGDS